MKQRINETRHKQILVNQVNDCVGEYTKAALQEEMDFYLSSNKDKLKTPPFVFVKRIDRPGVERVDPRTEIGAKKTTQSGTKRNRSTSKKKY